MKNRVLSVHQEHELLLKLEKAGLKEVYAQAVIQSKDNALAEEIVRLIRRRIYHCEWYTFTTTTATLKELLEHNSDIFFADDAGLLVLDLALANKRGQAKEISIRTSAMPYSFSKTWDEKMKLLRKGEFVPRMRDLVEGMIFFYRATGKSLFSDYNVCTLDVVPDGRHLGVKFFADGLRIGLIFKDTPYPLVGLAVARNS